MLRKRSCGSLKIQLIKKSRESALSAVQIFNNPNILFKSETYIVLMIIAWTYLLHAYFKENKIDIDLSITMDYFKTISKNMSSLTSSLNKKMPEYIKLNKFLTESKILRESIQSKINDGYDKEIVLD